MPHRSRSSRGTSMHNGNDYANSSTAEREQMLPKYESFAITSALPFGRATRPWRRYLTLAMFLTLGLILLSVIFKPKAVQYGHRLAQAAGLEKEPPRIPFDEALPATVLDANAKWGKPEIHTETISPAITRAQLAEITEEAAHDKSTSSEAVHYYGAPTLTRKLGQPAVGGFDAAIPTAPADVVGGNDVKQDDKPSRTQTATSSTQAQAEDDSQYTKVPENPYENTLYAYPSAQVSLEDLPLSFLADATEVANGVMPSDSPAPAPADDVPPSPQNKDPFEESKPVPDEKSASFEKDTGKGPAPISDREPRKALVLASYIEQKQKWQHRIPQDWEIYRYIADSDEDPDPPKEPSNQYLPTPRNQGREAMAYLTYIIDHYDDLPDYVVFAHGHDKAWHQPEHFADKLLSLNFTAVKDEGYINLRCGLEPGCTKATFFPLNPPRKNEWRPQPSLMKGFWKSMFSNETEKDIGPLPKVIGRRCCAQFAVTKDMILHRPLSFWQGFRRPLELDLKRFRKSWGRRLNKYTIGSVYEMVWHIVFGKPAIYCPSEEVCRKVHFQDAIHCDGYTGTFKSRKGWMQIDCDFNLPKEQKLEIVAEDEHWHDARELGLDWDPWDERYEMEESDIWEDMSFPGTMP